MATVWTIWEDCGSLVLARIVGWTGALVTQATLDTITYKVFDLDNNRQQTGSDTLNKAAVIFDTAQEDGSWPYDDGYNFRFLLPASCFPTGGHKYRVEFIFTPVGADTEPFAVVRDLLADNLYGS